MNKYLLLIIIILINQISLAANPDYKDGISNLVAPVSYFVNHVKQLTNIKNSLNKYRSVGIIGTSGIGKTQLSRMYAYKHKDNYNLIWFIDCNLNIDEELLRLAKVLNKKRQADLTEDVSLVRRDLMSYLGPKHNWLLVFDNLKVKQNQSIRDFIEWEHNGNVIFGSQEGDFIGHKIEMNFFDKGDSKKLAKNILERDDDNLIEFLVGEFKGYPVLIVQGAQLLQTVKGLDKEEYKRKISSSSDKILFNVQLVMKELSPSARSLVSKMALINNQKFSKDFLRLITESPNTFDDDLYQISKFALIANTNTSQKNPVFEMHDAVVERLVLINSNANKRYLEKIITKVVSEKSRAREYYFFITADTFPENLEIILKNAEKYKLDIYSIMSLTERLISIGLIVKDKDHALQLIKWFEKYRKGHEFNLVFMTGEQKLNYSRYIGILGLYNQIRGNLPEATKYLTEALEICNKFNICPNGLKHHYYSHISFVQTELGNITESENALEQMEKLFKEGKVGESDRFLYYEAQSKLSLTKGEYKKALEYIDKNIPMFKKYDSFLEYNLFTESYTARAKALNLNGRFEEAYEQTKELYDMFYKVRAHNSYIFGRIFVQMAQAELGQGKITEALNHINKAVNIFLADKDRNPDRKDGQLLTDPDLGEGYMVQGDVLFASNKLKKAISAYRAAHMIYHHIYKNNSSNVARVSHLYTQGAKAACKAGDLLSYENFGRAQGREFGREHPNTIDMYKYCAPYKLNLWGSEN